MQLLTFLALPLTASPSARPSGTPDPDTVSPGWWGFLSLLFLSVAVFFLWKSLNTQLRRVKYDSVPVDPETDGPVEPAHDADAGPGPAGTRTAGPGAAGPDTSGDPGPTTPPSA